jgi:class 3 adenylate cyclase
MNRDIASETAEDLPPVAEAIVIVDLVESTRVITRHGWASVGRPLLRALRECITRVGSEHGMCCRKFTGDGYMLTFRSTGTALADAVVQAVQAVIRICREIKVRNERQQFIEHHIRLRFALHYGEVYPVDNDREGPEVSYTFRLERVDRAYLADAEKSLRRLMSPESFPIEDYMILSQDAFEEIRQTPEASYPWEQIGWLFLKGFSQAHQLFLLQNLSEIDV